MSSNRKLELILSDSDNQMIYRASKIINAKFLHQYAHHDLLMKVVKDLEDQLDESIKEHPVNQSPS